MVSISTNRPCARFHAENEANVASFDADACSAGSKDLAYSGNGWPLVSGAKGRARRPTRKTAHIATPASRDGIGSG